MVKLIVALGPNNLLGKGQKMAWHIPDEFQFFRKMTLHSWLLMGNKTYQNLPGKLVHRKICVASSKKQENVDYQVFNTMEIKQFITRFKQDKKNVLWIAGGKKIYESFYQYAEEIYVSEVQTMAEGDIYLEWDLSSYKKELFYKHKQFRVFKYWKE